MIGDVLVFLRDRLNLYLKAGFAPHDSPEEAVVFVNGQNMDPLSFQIGAVSVLLINIEEENTLRPPDLYSRIDTNGKRLHVNPEIRLHLYVLFVAHFRDYQDSLSNLSRIIRYFQDNRIIDHQSAPNLSESIDHLVLEMVTLPFAEQNEIWNALRKTYHPSVLYKVKMLAFRDDDAVEGKDLTETIIRTLP